MDSDQLHDYQKLVNNHICNITNSKNENFKDYFRDMKLPNLEQPHKIYCSKINLFPFAIEIKMAK